MEAKAADLALKYKKPLIVIAGKSELSEEEASSLGIAKLIVLADGETSEKEAMISARSILKRKIQEELGH